MSEKLLYTSSNSIYIEQICQILDENQIPYIKGDDGIGQYSRIAMGVSTYSRNIYVDDTYFDRANDIIQTFISNIDATESDESESNEYDKDDEYNTKESKKASNMRRVMALICMFFPIFFIILMVIIAIMDS